MRNFYARILIFLSWSDLDINKKLNHVTLFSHLSHMMNLQASPPPTDAVYDSFDNLLKNINTHAAVETFAFAIKRSKKNKKQFLRKGLAWVWKKWVIQS